ncbi:hypothetical protein QC761_507520 [Podospora bellae-mahoneyi]|uniref:Oxidoreductase-like protein n=1 Tax=Podospora bellae-mahoneyi TaxID=2093777 RepID=A0ABR0FGZ7_9PEZI|nr:hypothetical protein QC761_507520 [Podospora bellae-mahoneyi]
MAAGPRAEARSLADINYIAANPPQYPHHPEVKESLTLYISRVPGTQDVVLSTMRPHRKNVTGEDIANSLYYIHMERPEDMPPPMPPRPKSNVLSSTRSSGESARSTIPRKPLPTSARVLRPESLSSTGEPGPVPVLSPTPTPHIPQDPSSGSQVNVGQVSSFATNIPPPSQADPSLNPEDMGSGWKSQKLDIRIDTSGYAKYRGMPSRAAAEIQALQALTSTGQPHSFSQMVQSGQRARSDSGARGMAPPPQDGFHRQVVMAYGAGWKAGFKKAFHRRERRESISPEGVQSSEEPSAPKASHTRQGSSSTIGSNHSGSGEEQGGIITHPGPGLRPKGYTFLSPWEGRCEFRTSTSGRSLKLRHVLDSTTKFQFDPREVAQSIQNAQAMGRSRGDELQAALLGTKPVSELRFNLPSGGDFFGARRNDADKDNRASRLSEQFSSLLHHRNTRSSDEDEWSDEDEMDLSLGKENAGGGSSGKKVKLGKLIIHDEGLKMLDLVVAANMGVWWTTWGKIDQ